mmetsp:Transcript_9802/g.14588  ORF Transcript_9802/g.14588 Transcript_9802/m.14588 type:complete len:222 (-) Transcript_9802:2313-2978(-)
MRAVASRRTWPYTLLFNEVMALVAEIKSSGSSLTPKRSPKVSTWRSKAEIMALRDCNCWWARLRPMTLSKASSLALVKDLTTSSNKRSSKLLSTRMNSLNASVTIVAASAWSFASLNAAAATASGSHLNPAKAFVKASSLGMLRAPSATSSFPSKVAIFLTLEGSLRERDASKSPAAMTDPGERAWVIVPLSLALMGIIIFMASTSTYGLPASTLAPLSCK